MTCRALGISDPFYRYRPDSRRDEPVIAVLQELVERYGGVVPASRV